MGNGGVAVERATTPAEMIGGALWRPPSGWLRARAPAIAAGSAGAGVCVILAGLAAHGKLPLLLAFIAGAALPGLAFAIDVGLRRRTEAALRRANAEMDDRVQQRTQALDEARQALLQ